MLQEVARFGELLGAATPPRGWQRLRRVAHRKALLARTLGAALVIRSAGHSATFDKPGNPKTSRTRWRFGGTIAVGEEIDQEHLDLDPAGTRLAKALGGKLQVGKALRGAIAFKHGKKQK